MPGEMDNLQKLPCLFDDVGVRNLIYKNNFKIVLMSNIFYALF